MSIYSVILATGSYTSGKIISIEELIKNTTFYKKDGTVDNFTQDEIKETIGVETRMYAHPNEDIDGLAAIALNNCFESSIVKRESIDYVIVARNSGDLIPSVASRVAKKAGLKKVIAPDITYGCQGWCFALKFADLLIKS